MKKIQIHKVIFTVFLFAIGFTMLTPLLWMISTSFKPENEVFQFPIKWIPEHSVGLANYKEVWGSAYNFGMYYLNSIKVTVISTVLQILVSALGAYGFTKIKWKGRDQLFLVYLATMMIPAQVMIVSRFVIMQKMNLYNTQARRRSHPSRGRGAGITGRRYYPGYTDPFHFQRCPLRNGSYGQRFRVAGTVHENGSCRDQSRHQSGSVQHPDHEEAGIRG